MTIGVGRGRGALYEEALGVRRRQGHGRQAAKRHASFFIPTIVVLFIVLASNGSNRSWHPVHGSIRTATSVAAFTVPFQSQLCANRNRNRATHTTVSPLFAQQKDASPSSVTLNPPELYPMARRKVQQRLLEKAQQIDPALTFDSDGRDSEGKASPKGSYSSIGWSNRVGTVLTPVALPGVYTADRPFLWNTIDVSCRMTLIQMESNDEKKDGTYKPALFVHSPVRLDAQLKKAVDELGVVTHIVSPNYEHVSFAAGWAEAYPDARMWGCPGLAEREPAIKFTDELPFGVRPPSFPSMSGGSQHKLPLPITGMWNTDDKIQALHFDCELNPLTGKPFFNEVVFYHAPSKSLMMTDTYWNYPQRKGIPNSQYERLKQKLVANIDDVNMNDGKQQDPDFGPWELAPVIQVPWKSLLWKFGMDKVYRPFYMNLMVGSEQQRQQKYESIVKFILQKWDVETLIPAHGDIVRGKSLIQQVLQDHFGVDT
jgi:hypothetical protein